jgi:hypothetical protein
MQTGENSIAIASDPHAQSGVVRANLYLGTHPNIGHRWPWSVDSLLPPCAIDAHSVSRALFVSRMLPVGGGFQTPQAIGAMQVDTFPSPSPSLTPTMTPNPVMLIQTNSTAQVRHHAARSTHRTSSSRHLSRNSQAHASHAFSSELHPMRTPTVPLERNRSFKLIRDPKIPDLKMLIRARNAVWMSKRAIGFRGFTGLAVGEYSTGLGSWTVLRDQQGSVLCRTHGNMQRRIVKLLNSEQCECHHF